MTYVRKRQGSVAHLRHLPPDLVVIAEAPPRRVGGRSGRAPYHPPRPRKLSPEQEAAIHANAGNRTLRELAAEFEVSHETVRAILRRPAPVPAHAAV
jgi:hypothetical protein